MKQILLLILLAICLKSSSKIYGQNIDTICVTTNEFKIIMQDLSAYRILRVIDSNNVVIIRNQKNIIENQKIVQINPMEEISEIENKMDSETEVVAIIVIVEEEEVDQEVGADHDHHGLEDEEEQLVKVLDLVTVEAVVEHDNLYKLV